MFRLFVDSTANRLGMRTLQELVNGWKPDPFMSGAVDPVGAFRLQERLLTPSGIWASRGTQFNSILVLFQALV